MKKYIMLMLAALSLVPGASRADSREGHWKGTGAILSPAGDLITNYNVEIESVTQGSGLQSKTTMTFPDGNVKVIAQKLTMGADGKTFSLESSDGKGGGACYGEGICQAFVSSYSGNTYNITSVEDGNVLRHLNNEWQGKTVIRVYRQKLNRVQ
jgi:hypothetical protein